MRTQPGFGLRITAAGCGTHQLDTADWVFLHALSTEIEFGQLVLRTRQSGIARKLVPICGLRIVLFDTKAALVQGADVDLGFAMLMSRRNPIPAHRIDVVDGLDIAVDPANLIGRIWAAKIGSALIP